MNPWLQSLHSKLLSPANIEFLVDNLYQNFKIGAKSRSKCQSMLTANLQRYLMENFPQPQNDEQVSEIMKAFNTRCYQEFLDYLATQYPGRNLRREISAPPAPVETVIKPPIEQARIISDQERTQLIEMYRNHHQKTQSLNMQQMQLLDYLTNPYVLQVFANIIKEYNQNTVVQPNPQVQTINQPQHQVQTVSQPPLQPQPQATIISKNADSSSSSESDSDSDSDSDKKFREEIAALKREQEQEKEKRYQGMKISELRRKKQALNETRIRQVGTVPAKTPAKTPAKAPAKTPTKTPTAPIKQSSVKTSPKIKRKINSKAQIQSTDPKVESDVEENAEVDIGVKSYDLSKLNSRTLPLVDNRVKVLKMCIDQAKNDKDEATLSLLQKEYTEILSALNKYRDKLSTISVRAENKIKNLEHEIVSRTQDENSDFHDLSIRPEADFQSLKKIIITFKTERLISEILLVSYHLPRNGFNVCRNNSNFRIYHKQGGVQLLTFEFGNYTLAEIFRHITEKFPFLQLETQNDCVKISHRQGQKFDLMIENDTIFAMLGFRSQGYRNADSYLANQPYNLSPNEKIYFSLAGTTMDPMALSFDEKICANQILKSSSTGLNLRQIHLLFHNDVEQCYDFSMPASICLKTTYLSTA